MATKIKPFSIKRQAVKVRGFLFLLMHVGTLEARIQESDGTPNGYVLETGEHYYAIQNLDDHARAAAILRGKAGNLGYAHDSLILAPNTSYREWILQARTMQI